MNVEPVVTMEFMRQVALLGVVVGFLFGIIVMHLIDLHLFDGR